MAHIVSAHIIQHNAGQHWQLDSVFPRNLSSLSVVCSLWTIVLDNGGGYRFLHRSGLLALILLHAARPVHRYTAVSSAVFDAKTAVQAHHLPVYLHELNMPPACYTGALLLRPFCRVTDSVPCIKCKRRIYSMHC